MPEELYHRYVEFKPFIAGMFTGTSFQGWFLNRALHSQHSKIYHYDRSTEYGSFAEPCKEMTLRFLDLAHFDRGGRIFTYVITLDGLLRFTETGKEFGIDLLSKHTMHSDVSIYIAFSGEFFVRRLRSPRRDPSEQETHPPVEIDGGPPRDDPPRDPAYYHLFIDNDSGTYRPNKDLLPRLKRFLERALPGLRVTTLDCQGDAERMGRLKAEQRERHKAEGRGLVYMQGDDASSLSSDDLEDLNERAGEARPKGRVRKMVDRVKEPAGKVSDVVHGRQDAGRPASAGTAPSRESRDGNAPDSRPLQAPVEPSEKEATAPNPDAPRSLSGVPEESEEPPQPHEKQGQPDLASHQSPA